jgi:phosphoglycerate dehydrogenase-like enzyme
MSDAAAAADKPLTIWSNAKFPEQAMALLREGLKHHKLVQPAARNASNLDVGAADPALAEADVAFGQPVPEQIMSLPRLRWVHLTTAGYTRYDRDDLRAAMTGRGAQMTNSSGVYEEPCAQHLLAMMMALARRLPDSLDDQRGPRAWPYLPLRARSHLLVGDTAILYGFGTIARRLVELLAPLRMNLIGVRRRPSPDDPIRTVTDAQADELLGQADHVINILPAAESTDRFFDARRIARMKPSAIFYNVGRGTTVDQDALSAALRGKKLAAAYLDVTEPEPLPPSHPLWTAPGCYITPHTAGGHDDEFERLVSHFLDNLARLQSAQPLRDRII